MNAVERPSARFVDRLWRSAATCGLHFPLTIVYFVTVIVLLALSIALMPLFLLGVPMLAMTLRYVRMLAAAERGRCRGLILVSVDAPTRRSAGLVRGVLNDLRAARTWRQLTYFAVALPIVGLVGYALPFALAGVGVAGMIVPFLPKPAHPVPLPVSVRGLGWWWLPIGVVCVVVACWLVQKCANGWARLVRLLLGRGVEDQLSERIETLTGSRDALTAAAEAERTRIERDLHDGAQQRLVALAMNLGIARMKLQTDRDAVGEYVTQAHEEAKAALAELRDLARGINPVILGDRGLDAALSAVAARSPIPVDVDVQVHPRPPRPTEAVAYFVVAEALTNVAKHSGATSVAVRARRDGDCLAVRIVDNGRGGADPARGSGLSGLAQRVAGAEGTFTMTSPAGGPTTIDVELPCVS
jgi:signal transduction histidine kinase